LQECGTKGSLRSTSYTPESAGECEGMNLHTPKATPTWGVGVPIDLGVKTNWIKEFFISLESY